MKAGRKPKTLTPDTGKPRPMTNKYIRITGTDIKTRISRNLTEDSRLNIFNLRIGNKGTAIQVQLAFPATQNNVVGVLPVADRKATAFKKLAKKILDARNYGDEVGLWGMEIVEVIG